MRLNAEGEVAQYLRTEPITQTYVFESDHALLRKPLRICRQAGPAVGNPMIRGSSISTAGGERLEEPGGERLAGARIHSFQFVNGSAATVEDLWSLGLDSPC